jgi:hypothetical protein
MEVVGCVCGVVVCWCVAASRGDDEEGQVVPEVEEIN